MIFRVAGISGPQPWSEAYARAYAGLATFDRLAGALRDRQDAIVNRAGAADGAPVTTTAGAVAAYLQTPQGHESLGHLFSALGSYAARSHGPEPAEQLRLPLEA